MTIRKWAKLLTSVNKLCVESNCVCMYVGIPKENAVTIYYVHTKFSSSLFSSPLGVCGLYMVFPEVQG